MKYVATIIFTSLLAYSSMAFSNPFKDVQSFLQQQHAVAMHLGTMAYCKNTDLQISLLKRVLLDIERIPSSGKPGPQEMDRGWYIQAVDNYSAGVAMGVSVLGMKGATKKTFCAAAANVAEEFLARPAER